MMDKGNQAMKQTGSETNLNTSISMSEPRLAKSWLVRWICIALAGLCLVLGTIGLVVPGLPTFDFYFLATLFAAKGSQRMHQWIVNNKVIAPILQQWQLKRTLPVKVKLFSLASMSVAAGILIWTVPHPWAVGTIIVMMVCVQFWMWLKA